MSNLQILAKHLQGRHNQSSHGRRSSGGSFHNKPMKTTGESVTPDQMLDRGSNKANLAQLEQWVPKHNTGDNIQEQKTLMKAAGWNTTGKLQNGMWMASGAVKEGKNSLFIATSGSHLLVNVNGKAAIVRDTGIPSRAQMANLVFRGVTPNNESPGNVGHRN